MALSFLTLALSAIAAIADVSTDHEKVTPVEKVIIMLEDLQTEVVTEGKAEAKTYDKFACFCKDMTAEKSAAIESGKKEQEDKQAHIEQLSADRDGLDEDIAEIEKSIKETEAQMKDLEEQRAETMKVYDANSADMKGAIAALKAAIDALKSSRPSSFAQVKSMIKTLRKATIMADALGLESTKTKMAVAALLQQPEVPMQNYDFKSEGVISMLEDLLKKFTGTNNQLDEEEVDSIAKHDSSMQELTSTLKNQNADLAKTKKKKALIVEEIETTSTDLSTISATLLDNQEYLMELAKNCQSQGEMWDQRTRVRKDELTALTQAISVIKGVVSAKTTDKTVRFVQKHTFLGNPLMLAADDAAMDEIEDESEQVDAGSEDAAPNFLQKAKVALKRLTDVPDSEDAEGKRAAVLNLLRTESKALKSQLLASLASQVAADPFVKIRKLIQELIERLMQEAADEANHKGWCDKEMSAAKQTRDYKAADIEELNGALASAEAIRDKLEEEIATLSKELEELKAALAKATKEREEEKAENEHTISEAEAGKDAVQEAIKILSEFYEKAATEGTELVQEVPKGPLEGTYKGKQSESGGILGMLDVILGDFERTIKVTTEDEAKAAQEFLEFSRQTQSSISTKTVAHDAKSKELDETNQKIDDDMEAMVLAQTSMDKALQELAELHDACVDTGMSYADRVAMREQEIDSLKKALCILDKMGPVQTEGC